MLPQHQPRIRRCGLGYEDGPREELPDAPFAMRAGDAALHQAVDMAHLACASGVCPI